MSSCLLNRVLSDDNNTTELFQQRPFDARARLDFIFQLTETCAAIGGEAFVAVVRRQKRMRVTQPTSSQE
jgi:hypothetical protein